MRLDAEEISETPLIPWIQILFNGQNITGICTDVNDKEDWAKVFIPIDIQSGKQAREILFDKNKEPLTTIIKGKVEISLKPDAPEAARLELERRKEGDKDG